MTMLRILGQVEVPGAEVDRPQQRAVLAYLLLRSGQPVALPQLIEAVWADQVPASARTQIHSAISHLRRALADVDAHAEIQTKPGGYQCRLAPDGLDLAVFRARMRRAQAEIEAGRKAEAAEIIGQALELWRGEPLSGINAAYVDGARDLINEERLAAVELLAQCELDLGLADEAATLLAEHAAAYPLRERLVARQMLALYSTGRQAQALELYERSRRLLADELGVDPGPEMAQAYMQILQAVPVPSSAPATVSVPALAAVSRSAPAISPTTEIRIATPSEADNTSSRRRLKDRRSVQTVAAIVAALAACTALAVQLRHHGTSPAAPLNAASTQPIRVFNVDGDCAVQAERLPVCSLGLAKNPHVYKTRDDVYPHRVWHGDFLTTDCVIHDGVRVNDEHGKGSPTWYRIRTDDVPGGVAWLPEVRTHDSPQVPECPKA